MSLKKRMEQIESKMPINSEPLFYSWLGHVWTEEEKAEAIRKHPEQKVFFKRLSEITPIEGVSDGIYGD